MAGFRKISFSPDDSETAQPRLRAMSRDAFTGGLARAESAPPRAGPPSPRPIPSAPPTSHETAGRLYLQTYLEDAGSEELERIANPDSPALAPDLGLSASAAAPALMARSLDFDQRWRGIPVFGGRVSVDVGESDRRLLGINGQLATPPDVAPRAELSPRQAAEKLEAWATRGTVPDDAMPVLTWYLHQESGTWHLTWHFSRVPLSPAGGDPHEEHAGHGRFCLGPSPRSRNPSIDAFVDALSGEVVWFFPSTAGLQPIPIPMTGADTNGLNREFLGLQAPMGFVLSDPMRNIVTYDFGGGDIDASPAPALPPGPVLHADRDLAAANPAAVSAHYYGTKVFDFFNNELQRDGVDGKGMQLVSVVNCWSSLDGTPHPDWPNAVWWNDRMWYGATAGVSLAHHLEIIGHELTHGVTASSSGLIYRDLPGALNESFSDIFGVVIANWYPNAPEPVSGWDWTIGQGLGPGGGPMRDMSDPASAGQPDHMSQYVPLPYAHDYGGVHIYSGIHNKAVHALLTDGVAAGAPTFPVREAVLLLYLTLLRLTQTSDFADSRRTLENVTRTYHGDPVTRQIRLGAIARAFGSVGL